MANLRPADHNNYLTTPLVACSSSISSPQLHKSDLLTTLLDPKSYLISLTFLSVEASLAALPLFRKHVLFLLTAQILATPPHLSDILYTN